jgi:hypothetical protein
MVMQQERKLLERAVAVVNDHSRDVAFSYDRDSDTMMVHFFRTPRPAVSIAIEDSADALYVRLDRAADEVVGLQIEGFLSRFISRHPDWADTLSIARLRGLTREDAVAAATAAQARQQTPQVAAVTNLLGRLIA